MPHKKVFENRFPKRPLQAPADKQLASKVLIRYILQELWGSISCGGLLGTFRPPTKLGHLLWKMLLNFVYMRLRML